MLLDIGFVGGIDKPYHTTPYYVVSVIEARSKKVHVE